MIAKNQRLVLVCEKLGADLEGICRHEGQAVFVPGALPGETFEAHVVQTRAAYAHARMTKLIAASPDRREPFCPVYAQCGGCSGQHMAYESTLAAKREQVLSSLNRIGGLNLSETDVPPVLGAADPTHCRNKTSLPVGGGEGAVQIGFYKRRSHEIVDIEACPVAMGELPAVIAAVRSWVREARVTPYDEATQRGLLRHVVVRTNRAGDVMVLLVATAEALPKTELLIQRLSEGARGFRALHLSVNRQPNNVILGDTCVKLHGDDAIFETLLGLPFEITPLSFFQVNPAQTERLYQAAIDFARLTSRDTVVDAYAGAGTIALCMARGVRRVVGLEIVPQAVESAVRNANRNGIDNVSFETAAVEARLPQLVAEGFRPDVVVLDPPRKGVEPQVIEAILQAAPRRVVYVSCHVPTQARDVALLAAGGYRFAGCQPVDMFCYASGVENVLAMERAT